MLSAYAGGGNSKVKKVTGDELVDTALTGIGAGVGTVAAYKVTEGIKEIAQSHADFSKSITEASVKLAEGFKEGISQGGQNLETIAIYSISAAAAGAFLWATPKLYRWAFKSEEQQLKDMAMKREREKIASGMNLIKCLENNPVSKLKGDFPEVCSKEVMAFAMKASEADYNKMREAFKKVIQ